MTPLINISGDQHAWLLYFTIGIVQKDICSTPDKSTVILIVLIHCHLNGAKNAAKIYHSTVGTVLSVLLNYNITSPGVK
jgi:hypothetical protein